MALLFTLGPQISQGAVRQLVVIVCKITLSVQVRFPYLNIMKTARLLSS